MARPALLSKPSTPEFVTGTNGWQILMAYNPWNNTIVVGPNSQYPFVALYSTILPGGTWQSRYAFLVPLMSLVSTAVRPFELFGIGCPNATGVDPRLGWQGLPMQGQQFSIKLRQAEPNGFGFFWLAAR